MAAVHAEPEANAEAKPVAEPYYYGLGGYYGYGYPAAYGHYGYPGLVGHPNGAVVPLEPKDVVDARIAHLKAHAEA